LENRYALKAPEQTTEEFMESVMGSGVLEGRYLNLLKEYMERCDLVKYAQLDPETGESRSLLETTRTFVQETKERTIEVPAEA